MDDSLSFARLLTGGRKFAELAMAARARPDHELFALHAGVAVERLAKAVLVHRNPVLLVEMKGNVEMLFHLTGAKSAKKLRTISMTEAISRLRKLGVLPTEDSKLDLLVELRNGVVHSNESETTEDLLPTFARTVDYFLGHVDEDQEAFWGDWRAAVAMAVSGARSKVAQDVNMRIQNARYLFKARISGLPNETWEQHRASAPGGSDNYSVFSGPGGDAFTKKVRCPACAGGATVPLTVPEQDVEGGRVLVITDQLFCDFCQLVLSGHEEMEAADLESFIEVDDNDSSGFARLVRIFIRRNHACGTSDGAYRMLDVLKDRRS